MGISSLAMPIGAGTPSHQLHALRGFVPMLTDPAATLVLYATRLSLGITTEFDTILGTDG